MSLARTARAHLRRVAWIARDALGTAKRRVLAAAALDLAGFAVAVGIFGGIYVYARALEQGAAPPALPGLGWALPRPQDGAVFAACAAGAVLLGAAAAFCVWRAQWLAAAAAMEYERRCTARVLRLAATLDLDWSRVFEEPPGRALARLASSASKQMGLVARSLVQLVLPLAQLVVGVGTMLWLDPLLTLLLLPLVLLYLLPLSRVNRGVAADQRELGGVARQAHGLVADGVGAALDGDVAPGGAAVWADELAGAALRRHGTLLFYRRRLADNLMQFVNTIAFVVGLLAVLVYHVLVVGDGTHTWTSLLLYLAAVKLAQGAVRHMTGLIVRISRLTPEFAPYLEFVRRAEALAAGAASSDRLPAWPGPRLRTGAPLRPSDDDDFEFEE